MVHAGEIEKRLWLVASCIRTNFGLLDSDHFSLDILTSSKRSLLPPDANHKLKLGA